MRKFIKGVVLSSLVCATILTGCNTSNSNDEAVKTVTDAITALQNSEEPYMVYNVESSGNQSGERLEVTTKGYTYTEMAYSGDDSSNGSNSSTTTDTGDGSEVTDSQYILYDWVNKDGSAYMLNSVYDTDSKDGKLWVKMPEGYGKEAYEKSTLYANVLLDKATLKKSDAENINTGEDNLVSCDMYVCDVKEDTIKKVLEMDTLGLLNKLETSIDKDKKDDKNYKDVKKFIKDSVDNYKSMSAYADGKAYFGVKDGKLAYVRLETGGIGTSFVSERVVLAQSVDAREEIDFESDCTSYYDLIVDYLKYVDEKNTSDNSTTETGKGTTESGETTETSEDSTEESSETTDTSEGSTEESKTEEETTESTEATTESKK